MGPGRKVIRWMHEVLHAVNDDRPPVRTDVFNNPLTRKMSLP